MALKVQVNGDVIEDLNAEQTMGEDDVSDGERLITYKSSRETSEERDKKCEMRGDFCSMLSSGSKNILQNDLVAASVNDRFSKKFS